MAHGFASYLAFQVYPIFSASHTRVRIQRSLLFAWILGVPRSDWQLGRIGWRLLTSNPLLIHGLLVIDHICKLLYLLTAKQTALALKESKLEDLGKLFLWLESINHSPPSSFV